MKKQQQPLTPRKQTKLTSSGRILREKEQKPHDQLDPKKRQIDEEEEEEDDNDEDVIPRTPQSKSKASEQKTYLTPTSLRNPQRKRRQTIEQLTDEERLHWVAKLKEFDLNTRFGNHVGLTRLERFERAKSLGLNPPEEIGKFLEREEAKEDDILREKHGAESGLAASILKGFQKDNADMKANPPPPPPPPPAPDSTQGSKKWVGRFWQGVCDISATVEKSVAAKVYIEQYFDQPYRRGLAGRTQRQLEFEAELAKGQVEGREITPFTEEEKISKRREWVALESAYIRQIRSKVKPSDITPLKVIGMGGFALVQIVRENTSGIVYAMKMVEKAEILKRGQISHVRCERDLMCKVAEDGDGQWLVRLVYSFQDEDFLYFIMEFMAGGDLLSLLIMMDIFNEEFAKFYVVEMIRAIEEAHNLGNFFGFTVDWMLTLIAQDRSYGY